jgi:hypothetical protein
MQSTLETLARHVQLEMLFIVEEGLGTHKSSTNQQMGNKVWKRLCAPVNRFYRIGTLRQFKAHLDQLEQDIF